MSLHLWSIRQTQIRVLIGIWNYTINRVSAIMEEKYILHGPKRLGKPRQDSIGERVYNSLLQYQNLPVALVSLYLCIFFKPFSNRTDYLIFAKQNP